MSKDEVIRKILDAATTGKHSDAIKVLDEFGADKWKEAQSDAAAKIVEIKGRTNNRPLYCKTPYKP